MPHHLKPINLILKIRSSNHSPEIGEPLCKRALRRIVPVSEIHHRIGNDDRFDSVTLGLGAVHVPDLEGAGAVEAPCVEGVEQRGAFVVDLAAGK